MKVVRITLAAVAVIGFATACGDDESSKAAKPKPKRRASVAKVADPTATTEEYRYDPTDKADPFKSFIKRAAMMKGDSITSPLERFDLSQLTVTGIIWGAKQPHVLVEDPTGKGYVVATGAAIGKNKGRIVRIDDNAVVVKETYVDAFDKATTKEIEMHLYTRHGG